MEMVTIKTLNSFSLGGYTVATRFTIRQYYEFSNVFIAREEEDNGNGHLFAYGYYENEYKLMWSFPYDNVLGVCPIIPELKKESDFITPKHYKEYIEKYKGKELLEVYAGNFRFVIDANTGYIYDKMESR
jgi:hypothetical protein